MSISITIPAWEDTTIEEAALTNLFVGDGSTVRQGQVIGELMVEKATVELTAPADGVIQNVKLQRGDVVKPGMLVAELVTAGEAQLASVGAPATATPGAAGQTNGARGAAGEFTPASPAARRLARELGVEMTQVVPADGQRITEEDVRRAATGAQPAPAQPAPAQPAPAQPAPAQPAPAQPAPAQPAPAAEAGEPLVGRRKVIAERMLRSLQTSAQLTLTTDVRADALIVARQRMEVTYTDMLAWITVQALKQHPAMNATLEGDRLTLHTAIHLGLAVAVADGLLVPVVRDAGGLSLTQLAERARSLTERARNNTTTSAELSGSTFSLTTLGVYEVDAFTPILNPPEVGILGIGRIREAIVPQDGQPVVGHMLALSLTFDHRAIDGAPAAAFLQTVKRFIESPDTYSGLP